MGRTNISEDWTAFGKKQILNVGKKRQRLHDADDDLGETDLLEAIAPLEEESEFVGGEGGSSESLGSPRVGIDSSRLSSADPGAPQPPPAGSAMSYPQTPGGGRRGSAPEVADPRKQSLVSKQV